MAKKIPTAGPRIAAAAATRRKRKALGAPPKAYFPGRELHYLAVTVPDAELVEGTVYFTVSFHDMATLVPTMEPWVFIGRNLFPGADGQGSYFQDAPSHAAGVRIGSPEAEHAHFFQQRANAGRNIMEFERALDILLACSLRRTREGPRGKALRKRPAGART